MAEAQDQKQNEQILRPLVEKLIDHELGATTDQTRISQWVGIMQGATIDGVKVPRGFQRIIDGYKQEKGIDPRQRLSSEQIQDLSKEFYDHQKDIFKSKNSMSNNFEEWTNQFLTNTARLNKDIVAQGQLFPKQQIHKQAKSATEDLEKSSHASGGGFAIAFKRWCWERKLDHPVQDIHINAFVDDFMKTQDKFIKTWNETEKTIDEPLEQPKQQTQATAQTRTQVQPQQAQRTTTPPPTIDKETLDRFRRASQTAQTQQTPETTTEPKKSFGQQAFEEYQARQKSNQAEPQQVTATKEKEKPTPIKTMSRLDELNEAIKIATAKDELLTKNLNAEMGKIRKSLDERVMQGTLVGKEAYDKEVKDAMSKSEAYKQYSEYSGKVLEAYKAKEDHVRMTHSIDSTLGFSPDKLVETGEIAQIGNLMSPVMRAKTKRELWNEKLAAERKISALLEKGEITEERAEQLGEQIYLTYGKNLAKEAREEAQQLASQPEQGNSKSTTNSTSTNEIEQIKIDLKFNTVSGKELQELIKVPPIQRTRIHDLVIEWAGSEEQIKNFDKYQLIFAHDKKNNDLAAAMQIMGVENEGLEEDANLHVGAVRTFPRYQNMGIAGELYNMLENYSQGFQKIANTIEADNKPSQDFHAKQGYTQIPDSIMWEKDIDPKRQVGTFEDINKQVITKQFTPSERFWQEVAKTTDAMERTQ